MITLENKRKSVKRWEAILKDYPNVKLNRRTGQPDEEVYGVCGFCEQYYSNCRICELVPAGFCNGIYNAEFLYWQIVECLKDRKPCKGKIQKMLKKIKSVKAEEK